MKREGNKIEYIDDLLSYTEEVRKYSKYELYDAANALVIEFSHQLLKKRLEYEDSAYKYMDLDAVDGKYKGHDASYYEDLRKKTLKEIEQETEPQKKFQLLMERSEEIRDAAFYLEYNRKHTDCCRVAFMIDVCSRMMAQGATLTEILKYVPYTQAADVYDVGRKHFGIEMDLSDDEKALVEEARKKQAEGNGISLADLFPKSVNENIPQKEEDHWKLQDGEVLYSYTAFHIAQKYTGSSIKYPYYNAKLNLQFADSFDNVVEKLMQYPSDFSVEGLEEYYGKSERLFLQNLQKKLLENM